MNTRAALYCLLTLATGCAVDARDKFEGNWVFEMGTFAVTCPGQAPQILDLTHSPPDGTPAHFQLSANAAGQIHEVDGLGCNFDWAVVGDRATLAPPAQSCDKYPDGHGGTTTMTAQSGEKDTSDGKNMTVHFSLVAGPCTASVDGTAVKQ